LILMELGCSIMELVVPKESLQSEPTVVPEWFATSTFGLMSLFTILLSASMIDVFLQEACFFIQIDVCVFSLVICCTGIECSQLYLTMFDHARKTLAHFSIV
jgi:hypothetical protein